MLSPIPLQHKIAMLQFFPSSHRTERIIRSIDKRISDAPFTDASPPIPESKVRKHTISVFIRDENGMINRIAGVFARRGYNVESLVFGLNRNKALFTFVHHCCL